MERSVSSHWKHHLSVGGGYEDIHPRGIARAVFDYVEVSTYRKVLKRIPNISEVLSDMRKMLSNIGYSTGFIAMRTACAVATLEANWQQQRDIAIIGDGCGLMGAFLRFRHPNSRLYSIDYTEQLKVQARLYASIGVTGSFIETQSLESIPRLDCAINYVSMQEMVPEEVARYFRFLRRHRVLFYCINRVEKKLVGGEVLRFMEYPWSDADSVLIDEPCPFHTHFLSLKFPFYHPFDGLVWQRIAHLAS
jgi:hypothetical protein